MSRVPALEDLGELAGKSVLLRADFNVPILAGEISDDFRIRAALPTVRWLLDAGASVTAMASGILVAIQAVRRALNDLMEATSEGLTRLPSTSSARGSKDSGAKAPSIMRWSSA